MTDRATSALLCCCGQAQALSHSRGAGIGQNSVCARVKIFLQPCEILVAFLPCSTMATRRFAAGDAHELATLKWRYFYFRSRTVWSRSQEEGNRTQPAQNTSEHAVDPTGNRNGKPFQKLDMR